MLFRWHTWWMLFQIRTWWMLFRKRVVNIKIDIYIVFLFITFIIMFYFKASCFLYLCFSHVNLMQCYVCKSCFYRNDPIFFPSPTHTKKWIPELLVSNAINYRVDCWIEICDKDGIAVKSLTSQFIKRLQINVD